MELEQLAKRLEYLEEEHRKNKDAIAALENQISNYEGSMNLLKEQNKELRADISRVASTSARVDQFDGIITQYRSEVTKAIEDMEKRRDKHDAEIEKRRRNEVDNFNKGIADVRKELDVIPELRRGIQLRMDEEARLNRLILEAQNRIEDASRAADDVRRNQRILDEGRKTDVKRITDLQGEFAAIRKRIDDAREKAELSNDSIRHIDTRINELLATENERRQQQIAFIEQQSMAQVERERTFKDWQSRFEGFIKQTTSLDEQIIRLEEIQRTVKRSQDTFDDINQRLERRINEITEMQRLAEDRFRQEWVTFKADDQKRWTNFSLSQEEIFRELRQNIDKVAGRITGLEDNAQTQKDLLDQTTEVTEQQLQELMNWTNEFLTNYERIMGRSRK